MKKKEKKKRTQNEAGEYPTFNFEYQKVIEHSQKFKKVNEQMVYLQYVLKEKENNFDGLDVDLYSLGPSFTQKIKNEIKFLKSKLEIEEPSTYKDKIVWMKNKHDFAFFFDKLCKDGFLSFRKDRLKMLAEHFKWQDEEMTPAKLKSLFSNVNRKYGLQEPSDEMTNILYSSNKK